MPSHASLIPLRKIPMARALPIAAATTAETRSHVARSRPRLSIYNSTHTGEVYCTMMAVETELF